MIFGVYLWVIIKYDSRIDFLKGVVMKRFGVFMLAAGLFWSCGKSTNPMESVDVNSMGQAHLTK